MKNLIVNTVIVIWVVFVTLCTGYNTYCLLGAEYNLKAELNSFSKGFVTRYNGDMKRLENFAAQLRIDYPQKKK